MDNEANMSYMQAFFRKLLLNPPIRQRKTKPTIGAEFHYSPAANVACENKCLKGYRATQKGLQKRLNASGQRRTVQVSIKLQCKAVVRPSKLRAGNRRKSRNSFSSFCLHSPTFKQFFFNFVYSLRLKLVF